MLVIAGHPLSLFNGAGANVPPVAFFNWSPSGLTVAFTDLSTDSDGTITLRDWNWGDGTAHGTTAAPLHTYAAPGTYLVTLTVTDDDGATHSYSTSVTVSNPVATVDTRRRRRSGWR